MVSLHREEQAAPSSPIGIRKASEAIIAFAWKVNLRNDRTPGAQIP
jgi:hypothetical protein